MILTKDESICLVLGLSYQTTISSNTKLNKLLARLNLFFIPIDFSFSLNKYGSFNAQLSSLEDTDHYKIEPYSINDKEGRKYILTKKGKEFFETDIKKKLSKIMTIEDIAKLSSEIYHLSTLRADEISDNEHKILLVDVDERFKLGQKLNEVLVDLTDLYNEINNIKEDSITNIRLKALLEYSYHLIKFLKEKRFNRLDEQSYDFDAHMFDYYFLHNIGSIIPFLKEQIKSSKKDKIKINKYYHYILNSVREDYPFSIENKDLKDLIVS